jgi:hypothetical protein
MLKEGVCMNLNGSKKFRGVIFAILGVTLGTGFTADAQSWDNGMYYNGMHQMDWGGQFSAVTLTGKVIVDSIYGGMMGGTAGRNYYLDTNGGSARTIQMFLGPYWYKPASGALRPVNGQTIVVRGGRMTLMSPPMLMVYTVNGMKWRDSVGPAPWSGRWMNRTIMDTTRVYCPTDSFSFVGFSRGFMGSGMMGGGMMWPDSVFCEFEQMYPDSLPGMTRGRSVMGFHFDVSNPQGTMMMQGGMMMGQGGMSFQSGIRQRFRVNSDSLKNRRLTINQMTLLYLDIDNQWKVMPGQTIDPQTNTISASSANTYGYYALAPSGVSAVKNLSGTIPLRFSLEQNYPNPFNPSTEIRFNITEGSFVTLKIYNMLGVEVASLVSKHLDPGSYETQWNGSSATSGIYLYRIQAGSYIAVRKMLLIK